MDVLMWYRLDGADADADAIADAGDQKPSWNVDSTATALRFSSHVLLIKESEADADAAWDCPSARRSFGRGQDAKTIRDAHHPPS
jgi:hypothetical protein